MLVLAAATSIVLLVSCANLAALLLVSGLIFGLTPNDPWTIAAAMGVLVTGSAMKIGRDALWLQ